MKPFHFVVALGVFCLGTAVFLPATRHGFSNWDDPANFVDNQAFRGLSRGHFAWFFTTRHMGHYQPLNWLSFALDHQLWGLDAGRFHRTQAILHGLATACVWVLARRVLEMAAPNASERCRVGAAAVAALLFGVHPLRVESVVWASARTDVLAAVFALSSVLAYLRYTQRLPADQMLSKGSEIGGWGLGRRGVFIASFLLFVAAVLSKEISITLPLVFLLLDRWPRRRWEWTLTGIRSEAFRRVVVEKTPFWIVSVVGAAVALWAAGASVASLESHSLPDRLAQMCFSLVFYPYKTLLPIWLSPLYEYPGTFGPRHPWVIASYVGLLAGAAVIWSIRKRSPGFVTACLCYVVLILPVSGLIQRGPQLASDRYSYIACLPFAIGAGYGLLWCLEKAPRGTALAGCGLIASLMVLTNRQITHWQDSVRLWQHAISLDDHNGTAYANLASAYQELGRDDQAILQYRRALAIRPSQPNVHRNLASLYSRQDRHDEAIAEYLADLVQNPDRIESRYYLGVTYERRGQWAEADQQYRAALKINPRYVPAHVGLARLLLANGNEKKAEPWLRAALELDARDPAALNLLAQICTNTGRVKEALELYDQAIAEFDRQGRSGAAAKLREIRRNLVTHPTTSTSADR